MCGSSNVPNLLNSLPPFQFSPAIRPFLQTIVTGLVSFGENYKKQQSLFGQSISNLRYRYTVELTVASLTAGHAIFTLGADMQTVGATSLCG